MTEASSRPRRASAGMASQRLAQQQRDDAIDAALEAASARAEQRALQAAQRRAAAEQNEARARKKKVDEEAKKQRREAERQLAQEQREAEFLQQEQRRKEKEKLRRIPAAWFHSEESAPCERCELTDWHRLDHSSTPADGDARLRKVRY